MTMGCIVDKEKCGCSENEENSSKSRVSPVNAGLKGKQSKALLQELVQQGEAPTIGRDSKYIFSITFKKKPLGISLTSATDGTSGYVTAVNGKKNKGVQKNTLPLNSKLLKVNGNYVEWDSIDDIMCKIIKAENFPIELTFCHPEGLEKHEFPEPNPTEDYTK